MATSEIVSRWKEVRKVDIESEFGSVSVLELHKCLECGLRFFVPDTVAGSPALYGMLEKHEWYYQERKWEHDVALEDMVGARDGVEIGCAFGSFVGRVIKERGIPFEGLEQNPSAISVGQSKGIPIRLESIEELARRRPASYDVVCFFQVLEHVTAPGTFLKSACELLRPGGKLILGVPNSKSSICSFLSFFDAPPHHMSRWSGNVLKQLPRWFPVKLVRIAYEPLQETKVALYVEAHEGILRKYGFGFLVHPWLRSRIARILKSAKLRSFLKAETMYASYLKR
jgi:SAM-dependent methyltransferase